MKRAASLCRRSRGLSGAIGNPSTLWLAPDQAETQVKLIDHEPPPLLSSQAWGPVAPRKQRSRSRRACRAGTYHFVLDA